MYIGAISKLKTFTGNKRTKKSGIKVYNSSLKCVKFLSLNQAASNGEEKEKIC